MKKLLCFLGVFLFLCVTSVAYTTLHINKKITKNIVPKEYLGYHQIIETYPEEINSYNCGMSQCQMNNRQNHCSQHYNHENRHHNHH